jgi:putative spermidine/putrescine transport system substrate-binding protein
MKTARKYSITRRHMLAGTGSLLLSGYMRPARASEGLVVQTGSGDFGETVKKVLVEPFSKETGIAVKTAKDWMTPAKLKLAVENKTVDIDVSYMAWMQAILADKRGYLEDIDYSQFAKENLDAMPAESKQRYGVGGYFYSTVIGYNSEQFSDPAKRPGNLKEFWDVDRFPGRRDLKSGVYGSGVYEEALIADGVDIPNLYPLDIDRAFKSLDKIRPHIRKWWNEGAEGQQLFVDKAVDFGIIFNNRAATIQKSGVPIGIEWTDGKLLTDNWIIPKGAPNAKAAQKFIAFAMRPDRQAAFSASTFYGPTNSLALKEIDPAIMKLLPTYPENRKKQFVRNDQWYAETGSDGKTNLEKLINRWNRWITL